MGYLLKEAIEKSPDLVQAYVNACYRAQQWIRRTKDEEITDLLWKPYMEIFKREVVLDSVRYYPLRPARQDRARLEHRVLQPLPGGRVDADLIHSARFLGASERQIMTSVIIPPRLRGPSRP